MIAPDELLELACKLNAARRTVEYVRDELEKEDDVYIRQGFKLLNTADSALEEADGYLTLAKHKLERT